MRLDRSRPYGVCSYADGAEEGPAFVQDGKGFDHNGMEWRSSDEVQEVEPVPVAPAKAPVEPKKGSTADRMWPLRRAYEKRFGKGSWDLLPRKGRFDAAERALNVES